MSLHVLDHPLANHFMAVLRDRRTNADEFRAATLRLSSLLVAEATRDLATVAGTVVTPMGEASTRRIASRVVAVPVLRAGIGMLQSFLDLVPGTSVGYFGLERDEHTAEARRYYEKVPPRLDEARVYLLDPMLATGGSALMAVEGLLGRGARKVRLLAIIAAPEGVKRLEEASVEVEIYTAAVDAGLNDRKYIVPGLGDFGDRLYGT